ncbi:MAG: 2-amino-4-hydroxy-6-hydroxymethyldihydropteridine diphosphokinase [Bacteroidales bacterium]|jgi:2-amino-4-hydroxy-6-hydroxymethyldihydropteridine diphosphokinase|nr:2-amino-4-hydroxy-6-hydroxymethyldihydropteridine diphosphokinase [Bacteroidales bacterium]
MRDLVLMLGTNLGDRQENLNIAINKLLSYFGKITITGSVYETEPWGYNDEQNYYNQAVVFSADYSPLDVLHICKSIEIQMGRVKLLNDMYENRIIDIDILFYGDIVFHNDFFKIPHDKIIHRRFVLEPLNEIIPNFIHPVLKKSIHELYLENTDKLTVTKLQPSNINFHDNEKFSEIQLNYNYIAIEGCIGAGKTSLATKIANDFNAKLILEQFEDNPFLPKFYEDMEKYAFPLELSFLATRYRQLNDQLMGIDLFHSHVIADYFLSKSFIFAGQNLPDDLFKLYSTMFKIMKTKTPEPDLIVYLYLDIDNLLSNIKKRGRGYEQTIDSNYLSTIQKGYFDFFKQEEDRRILIIDTNNIDFINNESDYLKILSEINKERCVGIYELSL